MTNAITCPKCGSDQITAQKAGFSGGKALAGAVTVGPAGALAGLHGSNNIELHCLRCGHVWQAAQQYKQQNTERIQQDTLDIKRQKEKFYADYESGQHEYAKRFVPDAARIVFEKQGLKAAYDFLKAEDKAANQTKLVSNMVMLAIVVAIIALIAYTCQ